MSYFILIFLFIVKTIIKKKLFKEKQEIFKLGLVASSHFIFGTIIIINYLNDIHAHSI